jgi:hypothetical protein
MNLTCKNRNKNNSKQNEIVEPSDKFSIRTGVQSFN